MPKMVLTFDEATGTVSIEGFGFQGKACDQAMEAFEKALIDPTQPVRRVNKPEYTVQHGPQRQTIKQK